MIISKLLFRAYKILKSHSPTPYLDADILLSHILKKPKEYLYAHPEKDIKNSQQINFFWTLIRKRKSGEPIAYLVNKKDFFDISFYIDKNVLIPRPDTELLVEEVINHSSLVTRHSHKKLLICDIGTGSGCIAIALKKNLPNVDIIASDISAKAIVTAKKNAKKLKINFFTSNLFEKIPKKYLGKINIIIFNPPYLTKNESRKKSLSYEPKIALSPDNFPKLIKNFFIQARNYIDQKNGCIFMEIGHKQDKIVKKIADKSLNYNSIQILKDWGGFNRLIKIIF